MTRDMTNGNIIKHLCCFAIPLILGNLFQLAYNAVDSIIVGKYAGIEALAAVGTANPVMTILMNGVTGICIGASVLMSQYFGAKDDKRLKQTLSNTILSGCGISLILFIIGFLFSKQFLRLLQVPEEILPMATLYLKIIFAGMPFTFLYNAYAAAMRSVGDSTSPIRFLAFASILNGCLDWIFIAGFHMGAMGAGLATLIAEGVSAALCILYVEKHIQLLQMGREEWKIDPEIMKLTLQNGLVTALQQACQPIGKLLIQGEINTLGMEAIAVYNAVSRVDDFAFTPEQSIASGMMTFISQNRGAGKRGRIMSGIKKGFILEVGYWIIICITVLLFRKQIMGLFLKENAKTAMEMGIKYLGIMSFFYLMPSFTNGVQGIFRGMGDMKITLISTFIQISVRVVFVFLLISKYNLQAVAFASAFGWVCMLLFEVPCLLVRLNNLNKQSNNKKKTSE